MSALLSGKVVFVTGGASGIGRECALAYAREGASVVIADVDARSAMQTAGDLSTESFGIQCDVSDGGAVQRAIDLTLQRFTRLDAVHNNAGLSSPSKPLHLTSADEWDRLFNVNLKSVYWTTRFALDALTKARGAILNTASVAGMIGQADHAAYAATKGGMIALTKAMALDYAPLGIRVNAISPAAVWTPLLDQWCSEQPDPSAMREYLNEIHALGYCPKGDVIGDAAVFLLSDLARFITGCILPVSGGAELGYRKILRGESYGTEPVAGHSGAK